jgi:HAD superfamily hydrolase (TIGR01484 family)
MKKLIVYDLDGTLAPSKSPIDDEMSGILASLLSIVKLAVMSGGGWLQFERQFLSKIQAGSQLANLSILPTCGTKFYRYSGGWEMLYSEDLTKDQREKILSSLKEAMTSFGLNPPKLWGDQIDDRGSQITFSALGQDAPLEEKKKWDPDFAKRKKIKAMLDPLIPGFSVRLGGTTSIDITKQGIDKAYGIGKLQDVLGIDKHEMLFIGDALFPGGNDYPAEEAGVDSIRVRDPQETKHVSTAVLYCLQGADRS